MWEQALGLELKVVLRVRMLRREGMDVFMGNAPRSERRVGKN
jgi:hypothetical protein